MTEVLVVVAHPDDAELAVGATIAHLVARGVGVTVACFTVSEPRPGPRRERVAAAGRAAAVLGHRLLWVADATLDQVEDIPEYEAVRHVDALVERVRPDALITHWENDSHGDHVRVARAVVSASRRCPGTSLLQFGPNEYATARHAEFVPNVYFPIADQLDLKKEAIACYSYPGQGFRGVDADAVELLARARGLAVNVPAAEGLRLVRHTAGPSRASFL
ncbi:PIG-L deacetylase family protein [Streptosporangium sp. DT93]|uniref:PIG-L deacetylase family protein n=1 Tax=Streptosporangium sp. DT93 TaxID=3393428 RepID=UPI003CF2AF03